MSVVKIAHFLRIGGSFNGGRSGDRWLDLPAEREAAHSSRGRAGIASPAGVLDCKSAPRDVAGLRARGAAAGLFE